MQIARVLLLLLIPVLTSGCASQDRDPYARGCVAADHEIASRGGAEILRKGGNAVDAAVATSFTLSVVRPYSCGIGGGGFMVVHFSPEGREALRALGRDVPESTAINYREMAPGAVTPDYYERLEDPHASTHGGRAVAVPGTVAGLLHALERYGTMERAAVLAPAIRAAEEGFEADEHYVASTRDLIEKYEENPEFKRRFAFVWERCLREGKVKVGDRIRVPEQARALRLIAQRGWAGFYQGPVAGAMIAAIRADGGDMTAEDLRAFRVVEAEPLRGSVFGHTFVTMPPPSSGGLAMLETLIVFERILPAGPVFDEPPSEPPQSWDEAFGNALAQAVHSGMLIEAWRTSADHLHPLIESFKNAFADRARYLADPAFVDVPTDEILAHAGLFVGRYSAERTLNRDDYGTPGLEPAELPEDAGTSHFCVVDAHGSAVSCTETINLEFGSCLAVPEFGIVLNNQMDDFTTRRGQPNAFNLTQSELNLPAPGKRPLSSMTPTIVTGPEGRVQIVAGGSGGPRIITATTQCILGALLNPVLGTSDILAARRVHHQWMPDVVYVESEFHQGGFTVHPLRPGESRQGPLPPRLEEAFQKVQTLEGDLRARGHEVRYRKEIGNVQMIRRREGGLWDPGCDPRKGGKPAGVPGR